MNAFDDCLATVHGNLLDMFDQGRFDVIVHGCNCFNQMGAGIAGQIAKRWPQALVADIDTANGNPAKLGTVIPVHVARTVGRVGIVVNAYTQFRPGANVRQRGAGWVTGSDRDTPLSRERCIQQALTHTLQLYGHLTIGVPLIGAGIAGGDWRRIADRIRAACWQYEFDFGSRSRVTVVHFQP